MVKPLRVLVVDDQSRARQSMKALLATLPNIASIREAVNGREAIDLVRESPPDLVLMDASMPEMDGVEATRLIKAGWPLIKIAVLSVYPDYEPAALEAGANAFVNKGEPPEQLLAMLAQWTSPCPMPPQDPSASRQETGTATSEPVPPDQAASAKPPS